MRLHNRRTYKANDKLRATTVYSSTILNRNLGLAQVDTERSSAIWERYGITMVPGFLCWRLFVHFSSLKH